MPGYFLAVMAVICLIIGIGRHAETRMPVVGARYRVIDLGTLGGSRSSATALNAKRQVIGYSNTSASGGYNHAFLYEKGRMVDLNPPSVENDFTLNSINEKGHVVGWQSKVGNAGKTTEAFLLRDGKIVPLGTLGGKASLARGINDHEEIVGWAETADGSTQAFLYRKGKMRDLNSVPHFPKSVAADINNRGQVIGDGIDNSHPHASYAFLWDNGKMTRLGTFGGRFSRANDINDKGQVVGRAQTVERTIRAFLWEKGSLRNLGVLPGGYASEANAINDAGQIVGMADSPKFPDGPSHAFIYEKGQMQDLNDLIAPNSGWHLSEAKDINRQGEIAGTGEFRGNVHAFLLIPQ